MHQGLKTGLGCPVSGAASTPAPAPTSIATTYMGGQDDGCTLLAGTTDQVWEAMDNSEGIGSDTSTPHAHIVEGGISGSLCLPKIIVGGIFAFSIV